MKSKYLIVLVDKYSRINLHLVEKNTFDWINGDLKDPESFNEVLQTLWGDYDSFYKERNYGNHIQNFENDLKQCDNAAQRAFSYLSEPDFRSVKKLIEYVSENQIDISGEAKYISSYY